MVKNVAINNKYKVYLDIAFDDSNLLKDYQTVIDNINSGHQLGDLEKNEDAIRFVTNLAKYLVEIGRKDIIPIQITNLGSQWPEILYSINAKDDWDAVLKFGEFYNKIENIEDQLNKAKSYDEIKDIIDGPQDTTYFIKEVNNYFELSGFVDWFTQWSIRKIDENKDILLKDEVVLNNLDKQTVKTIEHSFINSIKREVQNYDRTNLQQLHNNLHFLIKKLKTINANEFTMKSLQLYKNVILEFKNQSNKGLNELMQCDKSNFDLISESLNRIIETIKTLESYIKSNKRNKQQILFRLENQIDSLQQMSRLLVKEKDLGKETSDMLNIFEDNSLPMKSKFEQAKELDEKLFNKLFSDLHL